MGAEGRPFVAHLFQPSAVCGAALLVGPFVEERKGAWPALARLARALAGQGVASLLIDFPGCGDSPGAFDDTPPSAFEAAVITACDWLGQAYPGAPLAALGVRAGAPLAARLAAARPTLAALALWAPVTGEEFWRQLLQRRQVNDMVAYGKARLSRAELEARLAEGQTLDLDGYPATRAWREWLRGLPLTPTCACPVFLATGGHDERAAAALTATLRSPLRFPPFWNTVGQVDLGALIGETVAFLHERLGAGPALPPHIPPQDCGATSASGAAELGGPPTLRATFDAPPGEPQGGVLFLHGWSGDRTGPHRLFVQAARQLAAAGWLCLRPDFIGRGLSDGPETDAAIARMADDAQAAYAALKARLKPGAPIAVIAICSGSKVAVTLATRHPEIDRLLLWSAESMGSLRSPTTALRKTLDALTTYARKLTRPETWRKLLRGKVHAGLVTRALVRHETRSAAEAAWEDGVLRNFRHYRRPVLFVFGGSDPDAPGSRSAYAAFCRRHGIPHALHMIAHAGHSYYGADWTAELLSRSAAFLNAAD